jgi:hypothetical protein
MTAVRGYPLHRIAVQNCGATLYPDTGLEARLPDLTIPQAAAQLGVSVDTVKRRCRRGALRCRRTAEGRVLVDLAISPNGTAAPQPRGSAPHVQGNGVDTTSSTLARLEAITAERDWLRARLEAAESEREQLRILLGNAMQSVARALPAAPQDAPQPDDRSSDSPPRPWWAFWRG